MTIDHRILEWQLTTGRKIFKKPSMAYDSNFKGSCCTLLANPDTPQ